MESLLESIKTLGSKINYETQLKQRTIPFLLYDRICQKMFTSQIMQI